MPGNGWCTHPKRQLNSGVKLLVRAGELACRNTWGGDLFQSRLEDDASLDAAADLPGNDREDEVTSVSIPSNKPVPAEDRVVRDRPVAQRSQSPDSNDAAHRDQEERARLMARGNRDALAHARQRFSSRRQATPQDDVVADDDIDEMATPDRVITRQQRFSDRDFAAGMLPVRTAPVPREEVRQRGIVTEDRFDTIPAIDPDFDMPGQRHRPEPVSASAPAPEPPAEAAPLPEIDQDRLTAYEHVLQRARKIRETKQAPAPPLRRADYLPAPNAAAPEPGIGWHEADTSSPAREPIDAYDEPVTRELPTDSMRDESVWLEVDDNPESWADEPEDDGWQDDAVAWDEDDGTGMAATSWADEEASWEEDDSDWDDDANVDEPARRRTGWLHRLGFGRRSTDQVHDDAMITRHAASNDEWDADEPYGVENEPFAAEFDADRRDYDPDPIPWDHGHQWTHRRHDDDLIYDEAEPAWNDTTPAARTPAWTDREAVAQQASAWPEDDLLPRRDTARPTISAEDFSAPAPAPVPAPVPASERAGGAWDVAGMPVRPAPVSRSRPRLTAELPDIDDALFDDDRVIGAARRTDPRGEIATSRQPDATSPRESYFRSSRYPQSEQAAPFPDGHAPMALDPESTLPDIDGDRLDVRDAVERSSELIDRRIDVAPEIPRECRTCRSFRSADGGTRGWCTNEWAFTHRRMVNEDDLACVSAIGCWWMPADHLRLDLDEEHDQVRTPRMDELIARNRPAARKASGE